MTVIGHACTNEPEIAKSYEDEGEESGRRWVGRFDARKQMKAIGLPADFAGHPPQMKWMLTDLRPQRKLGSLDIGVGSGHVQLDDVQAALN